VFRDNQQGFTATRGVFTGAVLGILVLWIYDERTNFERLTVTLTENSITVPATWFQRRVVSLSILDKARTRAYNSDNNIRNRFQYTFWLINGESIVIGKAFYGKSQVNTLLEKVDLPHT
jgi:hypothetical protein